MTLPRMLMIDPYVLCDKHLLKEKSDLLELVWMVMDLHKSGLYDQCKSNLLYLAKHELIHPLKFKDRWMELSKEQQDRGWKTIPIPLYDLSPFPIPFRNVIITPEKINANTRMQVYLCSRCRERYLTAYIPDIDVSLRPEDIYTNFEWVKTNGGL